MHSQCQINFGNAMSGNWTRWVNVQPLLYRGRTLSPVQQKCQREFSRFTQKELPTKRLKEPDIRILKLLREEEFGIWLEDEEDEFDYQPGLDYLNEILHMYVLFSAQFLQELRKDKTSSEPWQKSQGRACPSSTG